MFWVYFLYYRCRRVIDLPLLAGHSDTNSKLLRSVLIISKTIKCATKSSNKPRVLSIIRFLNSKKVWSIKIFRQINQVYVDVMNKASVWKWYIIFNGIQFMMKNARADLQLWSSNSSQQLRKKSKKTDILQYMY